MKAVAAIDACKEVVSYLKRTGVSSLLTEATAKQEVSTRWNSHLEMLRSVHCQWDDVSIISN